MKESVKKYLRYLPAAALIAALLRLFYLIYPVIFATHDDMRTYMLVRSHDVFQYAWEAAICGRISQLWNSLLLAIPFIPGKVWFYKAIAYACFIFDIAACRLLLKEHVGKAFADCTAVLIASWACLSDHHNMLVSYALCHQLPIAFLFISLYYFGNMLRKPNKKDMIRSAVFLLLACMIYEAFMAAILLFALWAFLHECAEQKETGYFATLRRASRRILVHLAVLAGYMIIYYGWRHFYPTLYDGTELSLSDPYISLLTALLYGIAFFPVTEIMDYTRRNPLSVRAILHFLPLAAWFVSALSAAAFAFLLPRIRMSRRKLYAVSVISGIGIFVPVMIICLTPKYPGWIRRGSIGYLPSYYCFFFLVIFMLAGAVRLYHALPEKHHRVTVRVISTAAVFCICLTANAITAIWRPFYDILSLRYRNFDYIVSSEPVCKLNDNWQIFAPDNGGIHNSRGMTEKYLALYNTEHVDYITDMEQLSDEKQTFCMRMPENYSFAVTGSADNNLCANTVTVRTLVPDALNIVIYDTDGNAIRFDNVRNGDSFSAPAGTAFNFRVRPACAAN